VDVPGYLLERIPLVERALDAAIPPADAPPAELHAAMRHLLFPGGKRLRPAFALAAAEAVGAPAERALPVATAIELIHTYSLIHDDLPCMDDDAERRGRPSVHVAYGEATAILAGDALQAAAFAAVLGAEGHDPARLVAAAGDIALAAGSLRLVGGQVADLAFAKSAGDAAHVESVHARKTAALFVAAVVGGARLGGADDATLARLSHCAENLGIAFQIADDLLDRGDDDVCSLVRVAGPEAARARGEALLGSALREIEALGTRAEPLQRLAEFAIWRNA